LHAVVVPSGPISGEVLAPDGSVIRPSVPARLKLYRDENASVAELIPPSELALKNSQGTKRRVTFRLPLEFASSRARRVSSACNTTVVGGFAALLVLALYDPAQIALAPVVDADEASVKVHTMRLQSSPTLVLTTDSPDVSAPQPAARFLPMIAHSAQFLRLVGSPQSADDKRRDEPAAAALPVETMPITAQTELASRTDVAAPSQHVGTLAAVAAVSAAASHSRNGHHIVTRWSTTVTPATRPAVAPPQPARKDLQRAKPMDAHPSPRVAGVKRIAPTATAYARLDTSQRQALGAQRGAASARSADTRDNWRSVLQSSR
jgi:hypothetical protein